MPVVVVVLLPAVGVVSGVGVAWITWRVRVGVRGGSGGAVTVVLLRPGARPLLRHRRHVARATGAGARPGAVRLIRDTCR